MSATDWLKQLSELDSSINQHTVSKAKAIASSFIKDKDAIMSELNNGCGYHVLHNLPVDVKLPSQPDNGLRPYHKNYISEHVLTGVTGTLGYNVFSYKQEKQGSLVHEITPTAGNENDRSSNGIVEFGFHTDAAYLPREIRPEILALLCLKNDSTTGTEIVSLENITRHLSSKVVDILKSKNFIIRAPHSFNIESKTLTSLLNESDDGLEIQLSIDVTTPLNDEASRAMKEISEAANDLKEVLMWKPGDFLIFNNRRTLHGRGAINGSRWLQRCYGSRQIDPCTVIDLK